MPSKKLEQLNKIKRPLVSIIVSAFNAERKIGRCISALLNQMYSPIEVFIVDDGSKDNTSLIIKEYKKKHSNVILLRQNRKGPGAAKNLAAKRAKGKILVFVDSDEYVREDYIEKLTKPIRERDAKTAIGSWYVAKPQSVWARCRFKDSHALRRHAVKSGVFRAIDKSFFFKLGGFDTKKGYSDDRIPNKEKRARIEDAIFDHDVDSSLSEIYAKRKWIGSSIVKNPKPLQFKIKLIAGMFGALLLLNSAFYSMKLFGILILIFLIPLFLEGFRKTIFYRDIRLIVFYPIYFFVISLAMIIGFVSPVYRN